MNLLETIAPVPHTLQKSCAEEMPRAKMKGLCHLSFGIKSLGTGLSSASCMLQTFSEEVLVKAIHSNEFRGIFSLNHPKATRVIKKYEAILNEQESRPKQEIKIKENAKSRRKSYGGKNILNKLRKIENGQEEDI